MSSRTFGLFLIIVVAMWAVTMGVVVALGYGDSEGNKIFSYVTFGVAPLATIIAIWSLQQGG